jgi:hypothetical protein
VSGLPARAPAVVVGGGVMGCSILFHLAEAGVPAVLVERDALAGGSTSKAAGGVRAQFSDELNIAIAQRSLAAFADFGRRPGWEIGLHRVGYLFLLTSAEEVAHFERGIELQHRHGVPSELITPAEAKRLCPLIETADVVAAAFSPGDGRGGWARTSRPDASCAASSCATEQSPPSRPAPVGSRPAPSSAPRAPGRWRWGAWPGSACPSRRFAGRCSSRDR